MTEADIRRAARSIYDDHHSTPWDDENADAKRSYWFIAQRALTAARGGG